MTAPAQVSREIFKSTGPLREREAWSQPPLVYYQIEVEGRTFRGHLVSQVSARWPYSDELGFSYARFVAGEADATAGRVRPFAEAMNALRARLLGDGR